MFCPKCGKETKEKGLCIDCFLKRYPIEIKEITLPMCKCGRYLYHGNWNLNIEGSLKRIVRENLVLPSETKMSDLEIKSKFEGNKIILEIHISGRYKNEKFKEEILAEIKIQSKTCPTCSRIFGGYYEAVLQFRTDFDPRKMIDPEFISKMERVQGGFDLYLTSSNYAKKISKDFNKKGFLVKESTKLVGIKKGKALHRLFISIKSPKFRVGDFLEYRDKILQILELGKSVRCKDIKKRKMLMMPLPKLQRARLIAKSRDVRKAMVSSIAPNEIQLLDLKSYKTFELGGNFEGLRQRDEVEYLRIGRDVYLV